jgi:hypothetical protein
MQNAVYERERVYVVLYKINWMVDGLRRTTDIGRRTSIEVRQFQVNIEDLWNYRYFLISLA